MDKFARTKVDLHITKEFNSNPLFKQKIMAAPDSATPHFSTTSNDAQPKNPTTAPPRLVHITQDLVPSEDGERNEDQGTILKFSNGITAQVARQDLQPAEISEIENLATQAVQIDFLKRDSHSLAARTAYIRNSIASIGTQDKKTEYLMGRIGLSGDNLTHAYLSLIAEYVPVLEALIRLGVREIFCDASSPMRIGIRPQVKLDFIKAECVEILGA